MSVQENKALMQRVIEEGWNARNPAAFDSLIGEGFVSHAPNGEFEGLDGYKQLYDIYVSAFPDCRFTIDQLVGEGEMVSLSYTFNGTHTGPLQEVPPTGKRVSTRGVSVCRVVDGQSVQEHVVWDGLGLLQQLGLVE